MLISQCHFDGPAESMGPPEAYGFPHGPPKVLGPRGHCTPLPPSQQPHLIPTIRIHNNQSLKRVSFNPLMTSIIN